MDFNGKKVIVNGVTGFIGSNITKELVKQGAEVYSIDNYSYIDLDMAKTKLPFLNQIKIVEGDVSKKESWDKLPQDAEYIFHFAAPSSITLFNREPKKCYDETVHGLFNALEYAKANGTKKVVYPSTGSLYAGNEMPHHEGIYHKPRNLYAAAKVACEGLAASYSDFVKSIGLRIFAGYGPGEEWKKDFASVVYLFIKDINEGRAPVIFGNGKQTSDFVYIDDVVEGALKAAEVDYIGVINIGTGNPTSFNELYETIKEALEKNTEVTYINKEKNYVEDLRADTTIMKQVLDINPRSTKEGITDFIEYLKLNH